MSKSTSSPFQDRSDALRYLSEYAVVVGLLAFGAGAFASGGVVIGFLLWLLGATLAEIWIGRRSKLLPLKQTWKWRQFNAEAQRMEGFRLGYVRSALHESGLATHWMYVAGFMAIGLGLLAFRLFA